MAPVPKLGTLERRSEHRYPVLVPLEYTLLLRNQKRVKGFGWTKSMSSASILFQTANPLPGGQEIEISIAWPARLDNVTALQLHIVGRTVRTQGLGTIVSIRRYEFRTLAAARESACDA